MTVTAINERFTLIEKSWQTATNQDRAGFLTELTEMTSNLHDVTGAQADDATWLARRVSRVVRNIQGSVH